MFHFVFRLPLRDGNRRKTNNWLKLRDEPEYACSSAGWYWEKKVNYLNKNLNNYADEDKFLLITYLINGGFNGLDHRLKMLKKCYIAFDVSKVDEKIDNVFTEIQNNISKVTELLNNTNIISTNSEHSASDEDVKKFKDALKKLTKENKISNFERVLFLKVRTEEELVEFKKLTK